MALCSTAHPQCTFITRVNNNKHHNQQQWQSQRYGIVLLSLTPFCATLTAPCPTTMMYAHDDDDDEHDDTAGTLVYMTTTTSPTLSAIHDSPLLLQSPSLLSIDDISPYQQQRRPALSRTSSVSSMALAEADESFSQLTLLDLLVALDAHVDLASREIKKKGKQWKDKANSTAISVKRQAGEVINNQRRLRRRAGGQSGAGGGGFTSSNRDDFDEFESGDVVFDRELQKFREKVCVSMCGGMISQSQLIASIHSARQSNGHCTQ